jgi:hypothetical protein
LSATAQLEQNGDNYQTDEAQGPRLKFLNSDARSITFPVIPWNPDFKDWAS